MTKRNKVSIAFSAFILMSILLILYGFSELAFLLEHENLLGFDQTVSAFIHSYRNDTLTDVVIVITNLGSTTAYLIGIPVIALAVYRFGHNRYLTLQAAIILLSSFIINLFLKSEVGRARPEVTQRLIEVGDMSLSFPSGHSMSAMAFYGFVIYLIIRLWRSNFSNFIVIFLLILLILSIGASRIYLGVHYPSDVVAGFIGGLIWLFFCVGTIRLVDYIRIAKSESFNSNKA